MHCLSVEGSKIVRGSKIARSAKKFSSYFWGQVTFLWNGGERPAGGTKFVGMAENRPPFLCIFTVLPTDQQSIWAGWIQRVCTTSTGLRYGLAGEISDRIRQAGLQICRSTAVQTITVKIF